MTGTDRLDSLDLLRGLAILGILVMNIQAFAMVPAAYVNPTVAGPMVGADLWIWLFSHIGFQNKFLSIFAILFGAGILLLAERAEAAGADPWSRHARRMALLAGIGLAHAYLLWFGDILFMYAVVGLVAFAFRNAPPQRLLQVATAAYLVPFLFALLMTVLLHLMPATEYRELAASFWDPPDTVLAAQEAAYRGDWLAQMTQRVPDALVMHLWVLPTAEGWRILALMLVGMAAWRTGLLRNQWPTHRMMQAAALGFGLGVPLVLAGVWFNQATGWEMATSMYAGELFNRLGAPFVAFGWICLALVAWRRGLVRGLLDRLRAVGRTALTCYLLTTILCTSIFYGHGLGLFGHVDRIGQLGVVLAVWTALMIAAPAWLRRFPMGPVEWLWRRSTYSLKPS